MSRIVALFALVVLVIAGCAPATPTPPPDPLALITEAAANIRTLESFRMTVEATGSPYAIVTQFNVDTVFRRANAQYLAPDVMQAEARVLVGGAATDVEVFARGEDQWFRNEILTLNQWINAPFAPGFNPQRLIAEETGFQAALNALIDLEYAEPVTLESGVNTYHLKATANGADVVALLAGLIDGLGERVSVDVYIDQATRTPARFVIVQQPPADGGDPTTWTVDIFDLNEPAEFDAPPVSASTPEATGES